MMNKNSKTPLATRHIMIVIAGILICLGPCALVYNTWSIFVVHVSWVVSRWCILSGHYFHQLREI